MSLESRISEYRQLDALLGVLDVTSQLQYEVVALRVDALTFAIRRTKNALALCLGVLIAGIPTIYALLPPGLPKWISVAAISGYCVFAIVAAAVNCHSLNEERDDLESSIPRLRVNSKPSSEAIDGQPWYIQQQASQAGMRIGAAKAVLASNPPSSVSDRYTRIVGYWRNLLDELEIEAARLHEIGSWGEEEFRETMIWISESRGADPQ